MIQQCPSARALSSTGQGIEALCSHCVLAEAVRQQEERDALPQGFWGMYPGTASSISVGNSELQMQGKSQCNQLASYSKQVFPALQLKDVKDLKSCQGLAVLLGQCYQNLYRLSIAQCRNHRRKRENFLPLTSRPFLSSKST